MLGQRSEIARRTLQRLFLLPAQKKIYKYAQRTQNLSADEKKVNTGQDKTADCGFTILY